MSATALAPVLPSAARTRPAVDEPVSIESYQSARLARRLALIEKTIRQCERALRGSFDPRTGAAVPPARGAHREQLLSNLAIEHALAERLRGALGLSA